MGARQEGLVLVTKDEDFLDLSVTRGCPPKVVCLAIGNASNAATAILLLQLPDDLTLRLDRLGEAVAVIGALGHGFASINTATQQTSSVALTAAPWRATSSSISFSTAIRI
jgi:hypothetical protein